MQSFNREDYIHRLEKENEELKDYGSEGLQAYLKLEKQLNEAKDLIRNLLRATYGEGWNYSLQVKVEAEKFLKESE